MQNNEIFDTSWIQATQAFIRQKENFVNVEK